MATQVLLVDDEQDLCEAIQDGLSRHGIEVDWRTTADQALTLLNERDFDVVLTDLNLPEMSGIELCERIVANRPDTPVIVLTAFGSMESVIDTIRAGAYDFIPKPVDVANLAHAVNRAAQHFHLRQEVKRLRHTLETFSSPGQLIGQSTAMKKVYDLIERLRNTDATVLLTGESGTGKELVARALHTQSRRSAHPFLAINCAAVPTNLLESELFGHAKGAFTDAHSDRKGLFERAHRGTVLLDEIGEMALDMQPKLLRVLEERQVRPVGGGKDISFDTRVIASTNRDLETEVEEGRFREDLYYRLNVVQVHLPPLRARGNDILLLAQQFVQTFATKLSRPVKGISSEAARRLLEYDWPGNVRQLQNSIERAVTLTRFEEITVDDLPEKIGRFESTKMVLVDSDAEHLLSLSELEKRYIERVLTAVAGNKTQAAAVLGLDRRTLYRKLERYDRE
ncbi:MAG: sigma-54-dependent Fis family transcriptional regulator [Myxococcales bacterium]|nr:sigma-54-dependent Fis family transcriptional regulator [Myxococcales bacterium]